LSRFHERIINIEHQKHLGLNMIFALFDVLDLNNLRRKSRRQKKQDGMTE
jgi:hypothetical protein